MKINTHIRQQEKKNGEVLKNRIENLIGFSIQKCSPTSFVCTICHHVEASARNSKFANIQYWSLNSKDRFY